MGWQGKKSANVECVQLGGSCSLLQMLNGDEARILNEANLHGVNQNRICFTYQRFHAQTHPLGSARAEAWCNSSINQEASAAPVGISARAEHRVLRREIYSKHFARTCSLALAGIKIPPRFETMSERIHHGDSTTPAPHPPTPPPFSSSSLSEVSFFFSTACSFPFPAFLWCIAPSSTQSTQRGISPYHSIHYPQISSPGLRCSLLCRYCFLCEDPDNDKLKEPSQSAALML